jgi:hypothetical protein
MRRNLVLISTSALFLALAACNQQAQTTASNQAATTARRIVQFRLTATIQEIMDTEVDPAADFLWGLDRLYQHKQGIEDKSPKTDKDWETVRNNALILLEATNLLVIPGRTVATSGSKLDPLKWPASRIPRTSRSPLKQTTKPLSVCALACTTPAWRMLKAINARDLAGMEAPARRWISACEQCHRTFWYPNAPEPIQTLEPPKQ